MQATTNSIFQAFKRNIQQKTNTNMKIFNIQSGI